jgi:hypothetical protein
VVIAVDVLEAEMDGEGGTVTLKQETLPLTETGFQV